MKLIALIALIILLALPQGFFAQDPPAQAPRPTVELSLIVTDKDGKSVGTISKDEIRVTEDRVEQTVLSVDLDTRPIDYGVLIDSSGSLNRLIGAAVEAAKIIVTDRRGSDEIFIEGFISSDKIYTIHDFSTDTNALLQSLKLVRIEGGQSAVIDALYVAAQHVAKHNITMPNRRKALVIITDGEDRNSYYKLDHLLTLLREKEIKVFAIGLVILLDKEGGFTQLSPRFKAEKLLNKITEETGGRVFYPKKGPEVLNATTEIITNLRSQFRVAFQSSDNVKKGFRKVDVKWISQGNEKRTLIVPKGYYAGSNDGQAKPKEQKSQ